MSAFKGAVDEKFEGVETDLHQTKDGKIILLHDDDLSSVAVGSDCPKNVNVSKLLLSEIREKCKLKNGDDVAILEDALNTLRHQKTLIILDLKDQLADQSIKEILESGVDISRFRLTAFYSDFLRILNSSTVLSKEQIEGWNSIPRYENFRHPVFSKTDFNKNFHLFSAFTYAMFAPEDQHFGAWEVNYPVFLKWILPKKAEFIVTKDPKECMRIRNSQ